MAGPKRTVTEAHGTRRLVREYGPDGALVRIRVEPLVMGPTANLPAVERRPAPPRQKPARAAPPEPAPPPATPIAAELPAEPTPARAPEPPAALPEPEEAPAPPEPLEATPEPVEALPAPEPIEAPAPQAPIEQEPAPIVAAPPRAFEVIAVERVIPPPPPEPAAAPPPPPEEPAPILAPPPAQPEPIEAAPLPEPEAQPAPQIINAPEPEAILPEAAPSEPVHYHVPDLEARVDALFARRDRPVRSKKRAPLTVPQFDPLGREPWEDRLDAALAKQ